MAIAIASVSTNAMGVGGVLTKPTGLAVGDLLVGIVVAEATANLAAPGGWTTIGSQNNATYAKMTAFRKVADAGDVAASNFTFTGTDIRGGILYRITGAAASSIILGTGTPAGSDNVVIVFAGAGDNGGRTVTYSGYSVTGGATPTFTERIDSLESTGLTTCFATADGLYASGTAISGFGATASGAIDETTSALIIISATTDASGTNALHSVSPTLFTNAGVTVGGTGTNSLHQSSPSFPNQSGESSIPTAWTTIIKS